MVQNSQRRWGLLFLALALTVLSVGIGLGVVVATDQVRLGQEPVTDVYARLPIVPPTATATPTQSPTVPAATPTATATLVSPTATARSTVPPVEPTATSTPTAAVEVEATATATESAPAATATPPVEVTPTATAVPDVQAASVLKSTIASPVGKNLREGPSVESGVVAVLPSGAAVTLLRGTADNGWGYLLAPTVGRTGWVRRDLIAPVDRSSMHAAK